MVVSTISSYSQLLSSVRTCLQCHNLLHEGGSGGLTTKRQHRELFRMMQLFCTILTVVVATQLHILFKTLRTAQHKECILLC